MTRRNCELCAGEASVFCLPDSAFLCWSCDTRVHDANFLVARHLRRPVCSSCQNPAGGAFSGAVVSPLRLFCNLCKGEEDVEEEEESSSAESYAAIGVREKGCCGMQRAESASLATTTEEEEEEGRKGAMRRRNDRSSRMRHGMVGEMDARAEEVLERWGRTMGLRNACASMPLAMHAFGVWAQRMGAGCSLRVCLAGSLWLGVRLCEKKAGQGGLLRKLEAVCGVPSRIILLAESKLSRMLKLRVEEEGWAECSS